MNTVKVTVFTPVYNRANTLARLYNSLVQQTCKDFEWLVVNDGSTDDSEQILKKFRIEKNGFPINYFYKENGGKHRAINYGIEKAKGELFFIVDSDDWLAPDAIEVVLRYYKQIEGNPLFAGVAGTRVDSNNNISGTTFKGEFIDASSIERKKYRITGEKSEVFKTKVLREYKFPEFESEKFISEAVVWNRIAYDGFKLRWFNHPIYYWEYQANGLTSNLRRLYRDNPRGYLLYVRQEIKYLKEPLIKRIILLGKCIETLRGTIYTEKRIAKLLGICAPEYFLFKILYPIYKLLRNRAD